MGKCYLTFDIGIKAIQNRMIIDVLLPPPEVQNHTIILIIHIVQCSPIMIEQQFNKFRLLAEMLSQVRWRNLIYVTKDVNIRARYLFRH